MPKTGGWFFHLQSFPLSTAKLYVVVGEYFVRVESWAQAGEGAVPWCETSAQHWTSKLLPLRDFLLFYWSWNMLRWEFRSFSQNHVDTWAVSTALRAVLLMLL